MAQSLLGDKEFAKRAHYLIGQQGWEEVAEYALAWASQFQRTRRTPVAPGVQRVSAERAA